MVRTRSRRSRWWLVVVAALVMGTAGIYQFGWSSIRPALGARVGVTETALGTAFTLFVVLQTVAQFPAGWVRDRYGPRTPLLVAAACLTAGFGGLGFARSALAVYAAYAVGGVGVAAAYTVAVNTPVKWFTDRRGVATSVVTMAFSGVSVLAIPAIRTGVQSAFGSTMLGLGVLVGAVAVLGAVVLRDPGEIEEASEESADGPVYTWREAVRTWQFWLLYAVFAVLNGVGLMVIGKAVAYASALSLPPYVGTASASLIALGDAAGIAVVGTLSDYLGRVRSLSVSLALSGLSLGGAVLLGEAGFAWGFVALVAATVFFRSPSFAIVPGIVGAYYGRSHSSENYAVLYTAKLFGGVFGGVGASALVVLVGWSASFALGGGLLLLAGVVLAFLRSV